MAIELTRNVDAGTRARLESLDKVDHAEAQALAESYNSGAIDAAALGNKTISSLASYRGITASNQSRAYNASVARFSNVIPMRAGIVSGPADAALSAMAALPSTTGDLALDARPGIIGSITSAIS